MTNTPIKREKAPFLFATVPGKGVAGFPLRSLQSRGAVRYLLAAR
jgi:hypothetical protein